MENYLFAPLNNLSSVYVVTPHLNRLIEMVQLRGHNIRFYAELTKIIPNYHHRLPHIKSSGPGCSKLTTLLGNVSLKFQTLLSDIHQYFLLKKCEKLLQCKSFSHLFNKKFQCIWL